MSKIAPKTKAAKDMTAKEINEQFQERNRMLFDKKPIEIYSVYLKIRLPEIRNLEGGLVTAAESAEFHRCFKEYPNQSSIMTAISTDTFLQKWSRFDTLLEVLEFGLSTWGVPLFPVKLIFSEEVKSLC